MRKVEYSTAHTSLVTVCDVLNEGSDDIEEIREELERTRMEVVGLRHDAAQLRLSLEVLADLLAERGALDFDSLAARLAVRTKERDAAAHAGVECIRCHQRVPERDTNVTSRGLVCQACYVPGSV